ncbi:MAG: hypothetical protein KDA63_04175 [Planctomycetales bacterium]|nr:hypothetical protein [Planctomycetales bacterium]
MSDHPYGILSLLPSLVAIVLAVATRRVIVSLLAGIYTGALITSGWRPLAAVGDTLELHVWHTLVQQDRLRVFAFTLLMGAMVGVINRGGGMHGLVAAVSPWARSPRRGQLVTWLLGMFVFFDDYANTMLLGSTLRPLCDRLKISREKLAYIVDSTAAPVSGLALVSTWVAVEISYIGDGLAQTEHAALGAFDLFVRSIPYRFYLVWAIMLVPLLALLRRDFGPMLVAERAARSGKPPEDDPSWRSHYATVSDDTAPDESTPARWANAVVPIVVTVAVIVWLLYRSGLANLPADTPADHSLARWGDIFGAADSGYALLWGSLAGLVTAALLLRLQRLLTSAEIAAAARRGAGHLTAALVILALASTLSTLTGDAAIDGQPQSNTLGYEHSDYRLYTGDYLAGLLSEQFSSGGTDAGDGVLWLLPTVIFLLASVVSFSTGTSWGTMGLLLPMAVPLTLGALAAQGDVTASNPLLLGAIGGVLAGAIFGDHCSPISDTTVLSSQASGCDHVAHVRTQLPYALTVAAISVLFGTLPVGLGLPLWPCWLVGTLALLAIVRWFGKETD